MFPKKYYVGLLRFISHVAEASARFEPLLTLIDTLSRLEFNDDDDEHASYIIALMHHAVFHAGESIVMTIGDYVEAHVPEQFRDRLYGISRGRAAELLSLNPDIGRDMDDEPELPADFPGHEVLEELNQMLIDANSLIGDWAAFLGFRYDESDPESVEEWCYSCLLD